MKKYTLLALIIGFAAAQTFTNISNDVYGPLEYEVGTDSVNYPHSTVINTYFMITNITDSVLAFETPSPNWYYFRITKGNEEIDVFPTVGLPVITPYSLDPNESLAETTTWDNSLAVWDTTYRMWGIINIATAWSPFPKDSHFVEFTVGDMGIGQKNTEESILWRIPNPARGQIRLPIPGNYQLFDLNGRCIADFRGSTSIMVDNYSPGTYLIRHRESGECRKMVILE